MKDILALCNKLLDATDITEAQKLMVRQFAIAAIGQALTDYNTTDKQWFWAMK